MSALHVDVAGLVCLEFVDHVRLAAAPRRWVDTGLSPLATPSCASPDIDIRVAESVPPPGARIQHGLSLGDHGIWVGDRLGRGALLPVPDGRASVFIDRQIDPYVLRDIVYAYLLRQALWQYGWLLVPLTVLEVDGRRIGITGWSGTGKTQLALALLTGADGRLLGDDLVALSPDGTVAAASMDIGVRPEHRALVAGINATPLMAHFAVRVLGALARSTSSPTIRKIAIGLAEIARAGAQSMVGLDELGLSPVAGAPGPLDLLVVLGRSEDAVPVVGASESMYFLQHEALDALRSGAWPSAAPLVPTAAARCELLRAALGGVPSVRLPEDIPMQDLRRTVAYLRDLLGGRAR